MRPSERQTIQLPSIDRPDCQATSAQAGCANEMAVDRSNPTHKKIRGVELEIARSIARDAHAGRAIEHPSAIMRYDNQRVRRIHETHIGQSSDSGDR